MGAFDIIAATIACPRCGDLHYRHEQFFEPDYDDQRSMSQGGTHPFARCTARLRSR